MWSDLWSDLLALGILAAVGLFIFMKVKKLSFNELLSQLKGVFK